MPSWDFRVIGYAGAKHPRGIPFGAQLGETTHRGISSLQMEVMVWQKRCVDGSASHCQIIDLRPGGKLTMMRVDQYTQFDWQKLYAESVRV